MKRKHIVVISALALSSSLMVGQSFAAKTMNDSEMDGTTAAGQPRVAVGNGQQIINDNSLYTVAIDLNGQSGIVGDNVANVAGENNVAVGMNVASVDGGGLVDQINDIQQTRNASLEAPSITWTDGSAANADGDVNTGDMTVVDIKASADHVKLGHGDQVEEDNSTYTVEITDAAQADATVFNMVNAAGRNNVAVGLNAANRDYTFGAGLDNGALTVSQLNSIVQGN
jgi:hypothetical protein